MHYIFFILFLWTSFAAAEQHEIVWGQYIPPEVTVRDVREILNTNAPIELKPLGGGFSGGHLYTLDCNNKQYIVRRTGGVFGPKGIKQEVAILHEMNKTGICPKMLYADDTTGLIIMEKIDSILPAEFAPGLIACSDELIEQLLSHLRKMHKIALDESVVTERNDLFHLKKFANLPSLSGLSEAMQTMLHSCLTWQLGPERQLNHNDLHMRNMLYDGKKLYLIDWECAGYGPKDYDLAGFCNNQVMTLESGLTLYARYLMRKPTAEEALRFNRLRVINAATNGAHGYSHYNRNAKNPVEHLKRGSSLESVRNMFFALDRKKIDLREECALQACGEAWLNYALYLYSGT
ncbi:MAG: phosphotransferase [Verrucomicrobia bacterium]|nr:phosphotransferase [Verrucomicrobiota bacterium]MBS0636585.1 phosphotransferase [Verrucomicrobiota bacterium]